MKEFILRLFTSIGFVTEESNGTTLFFIRANSDRAEYYLVLFANKDDLSENLNEKLDEVNVLFDSKKKIAKDIEKNTSLIICVEFDTYQVDCPKYKSRLLKIEEDEFFYRKYVIPYTSTALAELDTGGDIVSLINQMIADESHYESFNNQMFRNESYFLVMQLFIKLPFLNLNVSRSEDFVTIETLLSQKINIIEQRFLDALIQTQKLEQKERDLLLQKVLDPKDNSFDIFINTFIDNAPST